MSIFIVECQYCHEQNQYIIMTSAQIKNGTNSDYNLAGRLRASASRVLQTKAMYVQDHTRYTSYYTNHTAN